MPLLLQLSEVSLLGSVSFLHGATPKVSTASSTPSMQMEGGPGIPTDPLIVMLTQQLLSLLLRVSVHIVTSQNFT